MSQGKFSMPKELDYSTSRLNGENHSYRKGEIYREGRFGARAHLSPDAFPIFLNFKNASKKSEKKNMRKHIHVFNTRVNFR